MNVVRHMLVSNAILGCHHPLVIKYNIQYTTIAETLTGYVPGLFEKKNEKKREDDCAEFRLDNLP